MNFGEIKKLAQGYTDRYDIEIAEHLVPFTRVVESKVNTALKVSGQTTRSQVACRARKEYYGLPCDFAGMRDIEIIPKGSISLGLNGDLGVGGRTLSYLNPESMNAARRERRAEGHYTLVADQLQICPPSDDGILEIVYYQKVPPLVNDDDSNWLSEDNPDAYTFGLCAEISAFAKDVGAFTTWDARFKEALDQIKSDDAVTRWSGPQLTIRTEPVIA